MFRPLLISMFLTSTALAETHVIECVGMSFVPNMVYVVPGDVIRWEYVSGLPHTATSGSPCLYDGLFHGSVATFNPVYEWKVPNEVPEEIPFMCIPHCNEGMTGIIYVDLGYTTWTVDDDGKADFDNIYLAVAAASDGDVILIMEGTYYSSYINPHNKAILVEGEINSKGELLVTVDGMQSGAILECYSGEGPGTVFRNLILTNGSSYYGGGMTLFNGSSPTVENCIFRNNTGTIEGGGIYLRENCNPIIINCRFEDNLASGPGGGMFCIENSNPTLLDCTFENNTAYNGGGMYNNESSPSLTDCTFTGNTASIEGGGMHNYNSDPTLTNCTFSNNTTNGMGGGMLNIINSNPTLTDTTVCGNTPNQIIGDWTDNGGNTIAEECPLDCPDINDDGLVNVSDLLVVIDQWGLTDSPADLNYDGIVDVTDLLIVVGNWGPCE